MNPVLEDLEVEGASLRALLPVVVTPAGVVCPGLDAGTDHTCSLADLVLLERLARPDSPPLAAVIADVAALCGVTTEALHTLAARLAERGMLVARTPFDPDLERPEPDGRAPDSRDPQTELVMPTPIILGVAPQGFEARDHADRVCARLSAIELWAALAFARPATADDAFATHRGQTGELGLDRQGFDSLVERLVGAKLVRAFDSDDIAFRRGYNQAAETFRRERIGRRAVSGAIQRSMERLDAVEEERRVRTGTARTKVFPVHAIASAWRNPPLSLGLILAYAQTYDDGALQESYDFRPDWMIDADKVEAYGAEPGIYLFSNYIWSTHPNLELSAQVKARNPASVTIHGGPDVPKYERDIRAYFATHPHVDVTVRGEGEITTAGILSALAGVTGSRPADLSVLRGVPGLAYRDGAKVVITPDRDRITDLDTIPSPYLEGVFDPYAEGWREVAELGVAGTDGWSYQLPVVVVETNRGCPYGCAFCDWGSATLSRIRQFSLERIYAELEWCAENHVDTVGLADANFGIFKRDVDITARVAELKVTRGFPKQFGTNYAKNSVKHLRQIVDTLAEADILSYGLLSLQSMDKDTLLTINRSNIKVEKYEDLAREFQRANLPLYVDLMVGLPGQTVRSFGNDMQECINREVHAKIFPTQLLVNSPMNDPEYRAQHGIAAEPGDLVTETASFTRSDYATMMRMRTVFYALEKFGVLRQVARYVRQETGLREIDFFDRLWESARADRTRWTMIDFAVNDLPRYMVPPVSWKLLLDELREFLVEELTIADDAALDTVLAVQHALLPSRGRGFPCIIELPHDFVAWHAAMLDAKHDGHLDDWPAVIPTLRSYGPGTLTVEDPRDQCSYEMGRSVERNPWDAWDLKSPVSRPVSLQS